MQVFDGDGLDKKQRLNNARKENYVPNFLYITIWHAAIPELTRAACIGGRQFFDAIRRVHGMGSLFQKEACLAFCASKYESLRHIGESDLVFAQGAPNGAHLCLGV